MHLAYAIPDHPWIDSADGAAVRIAMTVAAPGKGDGILEKVTDERPMEHGENEVSLVKVVGVIAPNLQIGSSLTPPPPPNNSPPSSAERTRNAPNRSKGLSSPSRACASS